MFLLGVKMGFKEYLKEGVNVSEIVNASIENINDLLSIKDQLQSKLEMLETRGFIDRRLYGELTKAELEYTKLLGDIMSTLEDS